MTYFLVFVGVIAIMGFVVISAIGINEWLWIQRERRKYLEREATRNGWTVIESEAKRW